MDEEFKNLACAGYPDYEINKDGLVVSLKNKYGISRRVMKQREDKQGYLLVHLSNRKKDKWFFVHRLVAIAFIPNPNNFPQINHKDENKKNNNINNLEWCDAAYNSNYGTRNQRIIKYLTGRVCKEETRRKIGLTRIGDKNPMKREEVRKKNSEAHKGKVSPKRGSHLSEETKQKIRDTKRENRLWRQTRSHTLAMKKDKSLTINFEE